MHQHQRWEVMHLLEASIRAHQSNRKVNECVPSRGHPAYDVQPGRQWQACINPWKPVQGDLWIARSAD